MTSVISRAVGAQGPNYPGVDYRSAPQVFGGGATFQNGITSSPQPTVTTPAVPATTVAATNTNPFNVVAYVFSAAAITVIKVNGATTGLVTGAGGSATVYLPAGAALALTYGSGTPTWVWQAV